jgi:hypothetical protein
MKKLVKPVKSEKELQLINALCAEFGGCNDMSCGTFRDPDCTRMSTCTNWRWDAENGDDILF